MRLCDQSHSTIFSGEYATVRHLSWASDHGSGGGSEDHEDEVRPSRREPSGAGYADQARDDHQPEPRLCGGRGDFAEECARDTCIAVSYTHLTLPTIYS